MDTNFKFNPGDRVKDRITGYTGIIIARCQWLTNCNTYGVKLQALKDQKPVDTEYFDEPNLVLIKSSALEKEKKRTRLVVRHLR
jgi:hypothetical protein